jgi:hypothetical protein
LSFQELLNLGYPSAINVAVKLNPGLRIYEWGIQDAKNVQIVLAEKNED